MIDPNLLIGILSLIIALVTLYVSYHLFNKGTKEKKPSYTIMTRGIIRNAPDEFADLKIIYRTEEISRFSESRVAFWNGGKETIFRKDISENDKIAISPEEGYQILGAELVYQLNTANNFAVQFINGKVYIDFDYIDNGEGCTIQIFHTGKTSWSLSVSGSIIGAGKIAHARHISFPKRRWRSRWISLGLFIVTAGFSLLIIGIDNIDKVGSAIAICGLVSLIAYAFLPGIISFQYIRAKRTSFELGVKDDDEELRAPDFPPTGRVRERDKDAEPHWS